MDAFSRGEIELFFPTIGFYESCNAIVRAQRIRRISATEADHSIEDLFALGLRIVGANGQTETF
jgi:hypothetical protein